ncbi:LamG-like jellyroll fold domain-containing protein [Vallitalea okinawensis]|uniref:LamG-like jellyroll fold domain-containing protein n=1 Tax=Vallitalea okinawensis TaxID=2078660 RepID=UPI000CFDB925|nr:LamG-like jellyroll fold domain-containing protein [Vallitalea okinawensis]
MGLIAHYPLNGDLTDYSGKNNHLTYYNNSGKLNNNDSGKIGKCYERKEMNDGTDYLRSERKVLLDGDFTFACWVKSSLYHSGTANGLVTNHSHTDYTGAGITLKHISNTDVRISCNTGTGTNRTYHSYYGTTNIHNKWSHLVMRYEKDKMEFTLWVNGEIEKTQSYDMKCVSDYICLFAWSTSNLGGSHYRPACKMNDVRVYDEAISDQEIKELAKAKILHYTFNQFVEPTENIVTNNTISAYATYHNLIRNGHNFIMVMNSSSQYLTLTISEYTLSNKTLAISGYFKKNGVYMAFPYRAPTTYSGIVHHSYIDPYTGYFEFVCEYTHASSNWIFHNPLDTKAGDTIVIENLQIEENDHNTPFTEDIRDYNTIRDISGFGNDGELTSPDAGLPPQWTTNSKLGKGCYSYDNQVTVDGVYRNIISKKALYVPKQFTICAWIKGDKSRQSTNNIYPFGWANLCAMGPSSGINERSGLIYYYDSSNYTAWTEGNYGIYDGNWHNWVITYDGDTGDLIQYVDGVVCGTHNVSNIYHLETFRKYYVGSAWSTSYGGHGGELDDARIYATALSSEDVLDLYETRAEIDDKANFHCDNIQINSAWDESIRNTNLVLNGCGEFGDITNWTSANCTYDSTEGAFSKNSGATGFSTDEFIKINGNGLDSWDKYKLEGMIKGKDVTSKYYFFMACYDKNKRFINHWDVAHYPNTYTTLAQDLKAGDDWVYLSDTTNWWDDSTTNYHHAKSLSMWLDSDDYPAYTYSTRHQSIVEVDKTNNRIRLQTTYSGVTIPAGSKACNSYAGGSYSYIGGGNLATDLDNWQFRAAYTSTTPSVSSMRYGTEYIRVGFLMNRNATGATTLFKNIKFYNVDHVGQSTMFTKDNFEVTDKGSVEANNISEVGIVDDSLMAFYPLNGDVKDYSGSGNHLTNYGAVIKTDNVYFDGNVAMACADNESLQPKSGHVSMVAVITFESVESEAIIACKEKMYEWRISSGHVFQRAINPDWRWDGSLAVTPNEKTFVASVWNNDEDYLWVNQQKQTITGGARGFVPMDTDNYGLGVGDRGVSADGSTPSLTTNEFIGTIHYLKIFDRALSDEEVALEYNCMMNHLQVSNDGIVFANKFVEGY